MALPASQNFCLVNALPTRPSIRAVIFDLGGTLLDWADWEGEVPQRWHRAYDALVTVSAVAATREQFVPAMVDAEAAYWARVARDYWSGPPSGLIADGFRRLGMRASEAELLLVLDGYARAVDRTAVVFPDARKTLEALRSDGYRLGLLSNTWWAAEWHNADLATHGLAGLFDEIVYSSDLPHAKPHRYAFEWTSARLGVDPGECVMVGDWPEYDIIGAQAAGMGGIWKTNGRPRPGPSGFAPDGVIAQLAELPALIQSWSQ